MFFYLGIYIRAAKLSPLLQTRVRKYPPLSVIICAKNEEINLKRFLPLVLEQKYPDFEVIVVNDCSDDSTADILDEFEKIYTNLKISTIKKDPIFSHGKKLALTIGIKAARHEHLIFTDADCYPDGK